MKIEGIEIEDLNTEYLQKKSREYKLSYIGLIILGVLFAIMGIVRFIGLISTGDSDIMNMSFTALLGAGLGVIFIFMGFYYKKKLVAINAELAIRVVQEEKERIDGFPVVFFNKCKKNNIKSVTSTANKQRAILIGNQLGILKVTEDNVDDYFQRGKEIVDKQEYDKKMLEVNKQRNKIRKEIADYNAKFQKVFGRDKRIKVIVEELTNLKEAKKAMESAALAMMSSAHQEKELDWASMGGAASALGGTAAGIAVATQAQRENENIRARNAANQVAVNQQAYSIYEKGLSLSSKIEKLEKELEKARIALVDEKLTKEEIFNNIRITYETDIDEVGVLSIAANVKLKQKLTIFDDVSAAVDGLLLAEAFIDGKSVGSTFIILPFEGIPSVSKETIIEGKMLIPYDDIKKTPTINITPYSLWAIEKISKSKNQSDL